MTDIRKIVVDYEAMYRALVRRLVEIADDTALHFDYQSEYVEWHPTVDDFIRVARAHEPNLSESQGEPILGLVHDKGAAVPIPKRELNIKEEGNVS